MATFKIQFHDDLRRIALDTQPSFSELRGLIARLFVSRSLHPEFYIKYIDSEGDQITIDSDLELSSAITSAKLLADASPTVRLIITEPTSRTSTNSPASQEQKKPESQQPSRPQPAPFDMSPLFGLLQSFGGFGAQGPTSTSQPMNLAPLFNMAMNAFTPPSGPAQTTQNPSQPAFDLAPMMNLFLNNFNNSPFPSAQQPKPAQTSEQTEETIPQPSTTCSGSTSPFFLESILEHNERFQAILGDKACEFIESQTQNSPTGEFPSQEEITNKAKEHFLELVHSPELRNSFPFMNFFPPEQITNITNSLLTSPIVQTILTKAYSTCLESAKKRQQQKKEQEEGGGTSTPTTPAPEQSIPVQVKGQEEAEEYNELEKDCLGQLSAMGFKDSSSNIKLLRQTGFDIWETIQLILQAQGNEE